MVDARIDDIATYAETRDQLISQLRALSPIDAQTVVSACPEWTVKDVVAHVCGLNAELLAGIEPPLGTDERTRAQVGDRAAMGLDDVCDEWQAHASAIAELMSDNLPLATGLTADLAVHVHDIAEDIETVQPPPHVATATACRRYAPLLQERLALVGVSLSIALEDQSWAAPDVEDQSRELTLTCSSTDFLRTVTGRRTRQQAASLGWSSHPDAAALDHFTQYGPFRTA